MAIIHQIAYCTECDEKWENFEKSNVGKKAYAHAKKTGHKVWVDTGTARKYHLNK